MGCVSSSQDKAAENMAASTRLATLDILKKRTKMELEQRASDQRTPKDQDRLQDFNCDAVSNIDIVMKEVG